MIVQCAVRRRTAARRQTHARSWSLVPLVMHVRRNLLRESRWKHDRSSERRSKDRDRYPHGPRKPRSHGSRGTVQGKAWYSAICIPHTDRVHFKRPEYLLVLATYAPPSGNSMMIIPERRREVEVKHNEQEKGWH